MTKLGITLLLLVLFLVVSGLVFLVKNYDILDANLPPAGRPSPTDSATPEPTATPIPLSDLIKVDAPLPDTAITSPLKVNGQARGTWYFEASFPVKLLGTDEEILATAPAQAQGEWMTTDWVPFSVELKFTKPAGQAGWLVLEKDNPSGLPESAAELRIPIKF